MTLYYGVVGNRDYIKHGGERKPFWHFLDQQPDSWLTSLVYQRRDVPHVPRRIWDCGAWSYKDADVPKIGANLVTPEWALAQYAGLASEGDMVVAPDHMLIPGKDLDFRRRWNEESVSEFLKQCSPHLIPLAVIHGQGIDERVEHAKHLLSLGYQHLAVGGVAARAGSKKEVFAVVAALREITRGAWLHVLGLSSPEYIRKWQDLGVDSCDGASHFKQAFTAGAFFVADEGSLRKLQAVRPGESADAIPPCDCTACRLLREEGIDTRSYGSNENNMGRAAHNLNMLLRAHDAVLTETIALVACAATKRGHACPAADLYVSDLFQKSRAWAEQHVDRWFILSAKHGLIDPEQVIAPYNETLNDKSAAERAAWGQCVLSQIGPTRRKRFVLLAGEAYAGPLAALGADRPLRGLGIGQQLAWLKANTGRRPHSGQQFLFTEDS